MVFAWWPWWGKTHRYEVVDDAELKDWEKEYLGRRFTEITNELARQRKYSEDIDRQILVRLQEQDAQLARVKQDIYTQMSHDLRHHHGKIFERLAEQDGLICRATNDHAKYVENSIIMYLRRWEQQFINLDKKLNQTIELAKIRRRRKSELVSPHQQEEEIEVQV